MKTLHRLITTFQSNQFLTTPEKVSTIQQLLDPVVKKGVEAKEILYASHHKIGLIVSFKGVDWRVKILPTFHGLELKITGLDSEDSKKQLSKIFREAYPLFDSLDIKQLDYIAKKGHECPVCGSFDLETLGDIGGDLSELIEVAYCHGCRSTWRDVYTLKGYTQLETAG